MQITLCEDDSLFFDGIPQNVVIVVKFDDGKTRRFPYSAEKSISALYQDLKSIIPQVSQAKEPSLLDLDAHTEPLEEIKTASQSQVKSLSEGLQNANKSHTAEPPQDKSRIIEKEDFVRLIRLDEGRNKEQSCLLVVGNEYRVISIISTGVTLPGRKDITRMVNGYDVVDDLSDSPERTRVFPHEVELSRKRTSPIVKKVSMIEEILPCPMCSVPNALGLQGTDFKGICTACSAEISIARIIKKCQTDKCNNDVSCFDVGGKYEGKCNKCRSSIEVPYN